MSKSKHNFHRNIAIIIGINDYSNGVPRLETAVPDAEEFARLMQERYQYEVHLLLNEDATLNKLKQLIDCFSNKKIPFGKNPDINDKDRIILYFAGHGKAFDAKEKQEGPVGYLIPQDATDNPDTYLKMQDFHDALLKLPCRHLLVILDCCFSGAFYWSSINRDVVPKVKLYKQVYDHYIKYRAWQVITSTSDKQTAIDSPPRGKVVVGSKVHSPFAKHLFDVLKKNDDYDGGIITANDLYRFLRKAVAVETEEYKAQTPGICQLKLHENGEYLFLLQSEPNLEDAPPLRLEDSPYRGLESYEEEHKDLYFGRKEQIEQLYEKVNNSNHRALTVVLGASGTGKSSLVKAGLIPFLIKQRSEVNSNLQTWKILKPIRLGESPLTALTNSLSQELNFIYPNPGSEQRQADEPRGFSKILSWFGIRRESNTAKQNQPLEKQVEFLSQNLKNWFDKNSGRTLMLTIDQFEELITLQPRQEDKEQNKKQKQKNKREEKQREKTQQELVLKWLPQVMSQYGERLRIVLTLRSDFESQFQDTALKDYWKEEARFHIKEMTTAELREVITEPASKRSIFFVPDKLIDKLVYEVAGMPGTLPLLSFTLNELYRLFIEDINDGDKDDRGITEEYYNKLGGVGRSLTKKADQEYENLVNQDKAYEQTIRRVMLRMVAVGGSELARRRVLKSELEYPEPENTRVLKVVKTFVDARLLVEGENTEKKPYVEPAHDALVRGWERLLKWKQEEEENLILQRQLTPAADEWKFERSQAKGYLWHNNPRLDLLKKELKSNDKWFNKLETEFVQLSIARKTLLARRFTIGAVVVIVLLSAGLIASLIGQRNARIGQIRASQQASEANFISNQQLNALINSLQAAKTLKDWPWYLSWFKPDDRIPFLFETDNELQPQVLKTLRKIVYEIKERNQIESSSNTITNSFFKKSILDRQLIIFNEMCAINLPKLNKEINLLSVDPLVKNKVLEDIKNPSKSLEYMAVIMKVIVSSDGKSLMVVYNQACGGDFITSHLWRLVGNEVKSYPLNFVNSGRFYRNKLLATGSTQGEIRILDLTNQSVLGNQSVEYQELLKLQGHQGVVNNILFSADSKQLKTEGADGVIRLWDWQNKPLKGLEKKLTQKVSKLSFSPDGKHLVTVGKDGIAFLWKYHSQEFNQIKQLPNKVINISFRSNGKQLATVGKDGIVRLHNWGINSLKELKEIQGKVMNVSFSPDSESKQLAVIKQNDRGDKSIYLLSLDRENITSTLKIDEDKTTQEFSSESKVIFSPDSQQLARFEPYGLEGKSGIVFVWDLKGRVLVGSTEAFDFTFNEGKLVIASLDQSSGGKITVSNFNSESNNKELKALDTAGEEGSFSPDGNLLALADNDGNIYLWDWKSEKLLSQFKGHQSKIKSINFSPDSSLLATVGEDGTAKLWQIGELEDLIELGCNWARDYLATLDDKNNARHLCNFEAISMGDKILISTLSDPDKQSGVEAIAAGNFPQAITSLTAYLDPTKNPNDPEARIYLNNARIGNQKSYTIAVSVPLSDVNGSLEILRGVAQAQDDFNNWAKTQQGIVPIRVLIADDRNEPKIAQEIAKQLANNPDVLGVVGHFSSSVTREAAQVYNDKKLVAISPVSTSVQLSDVLGKYVFRTVPNDKVAAEKLADYTVNSLKKQKAVLFYNSQSEYSCSLASEFTTAFSGERGKQLERDCSKYGTSSATSAEKRQGQIFKEIDLSNPDFDATKSLEGLDQNTVLVLLADTSKFNQSFEILKANQGNLPILAGDDVYGSKILEFFSKEKLNNKKDMVVAIPWHIKNNRELGLGTTSKGLWGDRDINWRTVTAYDAAKALIAAIKHNPNREEVAKILRTDSFNAQGAIEPVKFSSGDRDGNIIELVKIVKPTSKSRSGYDYEFVPVENQTNSNQVTKPKNSK
ncbi:caspase family protein [Microcoleus sp. w1-18aA5]|uniref:nSTAND1 domain-containing NTPase n=1 Tax=Microcoleus sp. w1-18aA5 TaxID=2818982 RepID=UPI002FD5D5AC